MSLNTIPKSIQNSAILTGINLARLGNIEKLPTMNDVDKFIEENQNFIGLNTNDYHKFARDFLNKNDVESAYKVLLINEKN